MRQPSKTLISAAFLAVLASGPAIAAGSGGGGGGSSAPSQTAPKYDAAAEYKKGIAALKAEDYKAATMAFRRVVTVAPRNASAQYLLGVSYSQSGNYKKAVKPLKRAVKYNDDHVEAKRDLAIAYAKSGKDKKGQEALDALKKAQEACGECAKKTRFGEAVSKVEASMAGEEQAGLTLEPAFLADNGQTGDKAYVEAVALINAKRYEDAIVDLQKASQAFGPHPDILTYLGFANRKLQRFDVAEDYYKRALNVAPKHLGATEYYGELMVERGDLKGAKLKLARLNSLCSFGCYEAEELRRWIAESEAKQG